MKKYTKGCYSSGGQIMPGDIKVVTEKKGYASGGSVGGGPGDPKINLNYKQKEQLNNTATAGSPQYKQTLQEATGMRTSSAPAGSSTWRKAKADNEAAVKNFNANNSPTAGLNSPKTDVKYSLMNRARAIDPGVDTNKRLTGYVENSQDKRVSKPGLAKGGLVSKVMMKMKKC